MLFILRHIKKIFCSLLLFISAESTWADHTTIDLEVHTDCGLHLSPRSNEGGTNLTTESVIAMLSGYTSNYSAGEANVYILKFFRANYQRMTASQVLFLMQFVRNAVSTPPTRQWVPFMHHKPVLEEIYRTALVRFPKMTDAEKTRFHEYYLQALTKAHLSF